MMTKKRSAEKTVRDIRRATALKETLAELLMENRVLKKSVIGGGEDDI